MKEKKGNNESRSSAKGREGWFSFTFKPLGYLAAHIRVNRKVSPLISPLRPLSCLPSIASLFSSPLPLLYAPGPPSVWEDLGRLEGYGLVVGLLAGFGFIGRLIAFVK